MPGGGVGGAGVRGGPVAPLVLQRGGGPVPRVHIPGLRRRPQQLPLAAGMRRGLHPRERYCSESLASPRRRCQCSTLHPTPFPLVRSLANPKITTVLPATFPVSDQITGQSWQQYRCTPYSVSHPVSKILTSIPKTMIHNLIM